MRTHTYLAVAAALLCAAEYAKASPEATEALRTRPGAVGSPTRVELGLFFSDVISISDVDQSYRADIYTRTEWSDPRLKGSETRVLPLSEIWHPNLQVVNARDLEEALPAVATVSPDGHVTYLQRVTGSFSSRMDLHEFPYDRQVLPVSIVSLASTSEEVELWPKTASTQGFEQFSAIGWRLILGSARSEPLFIPATGRELAQVVFTVDAIRDVGYYRWTMYVPLVLIVLMAWMVFWIDPLLMPPRVSLSTASVLTLIAFRFSMRLSLPAVSYMTRMDTFLLGCTALVFLALGLAVATGRLAKQGREDFARSVEARGRWIYLGVFIVFSILYYS